MNELPPTVNPDYVVPLLPPPPDPYRVGQELPKRLGVEDMCRCFGQDGLSMSRSTFHRWRRLGKFDRFEVRPQIGRRAWSGELVARYLRCEAPSSRFITTSLSRRAAAAVRAALAPQDGDPA